MSSLISVNLQARKHGRRRLRAWGQERGFTWGPFGDSNLVQPTVATIAVTTAWGLLLNKDRKWRRHWFLCLVIYYAFNLRGTENNPAEVWSNEMRRDLSRILQVCCWWSFPWRPHAISWVPQLSQSSCMITFWNLLNKFNKSYWKHFSLILFDTSLYFLILLIPFLSSLYFLIHPYIF